MPWNSLSARPRLPPLPSRPAPPSIIHCWNARGWRDRRWRRAHRARWSRGCRCRGCAHLRDKRLRCALRGRERDVGLAEQRLLAQLRLRADRDGREALLHLEGHARAAVRARDDFLHAADLHARDADIGLGGELGRLGEGGGDAVALRLEGMAPPNCIQRNSVRLKHESAKSTIVRSLPSVGTWRFMSLDPARSWSSARSTTPFPCLECQAGRGSLVLRGCRWKRR